MSKRSMFIPISEIPLGSLVGAALGVLVLVLAGLAIPGCGARKEQPAKPEVTKETAAPEVPHQDTAVPHPSTGDLSWDDQLAQLRKQGLDIVFVFDSTGSMGGVILEARTNIRKLMAVITQAVPGARLGVVSYRDMKQYDLDDYEYTTKAIQLTTDVARLERFLRGCEAFGGGDIPEDIYDGLDVAINQERWNQGTAKVIVVFGDAPPRPENDGLNKVYDLIAKWHKDTGGIVSCIDTTGERKLMSEFKEMAKSGGGEAVGLANGDALARQLLVMVFGSRYEKEVDKTFKDIEKAREDEMKKENDKGLGPEGGPTY